MSNEKIRHWVYTGIGIALLIWAAWFLLMHPSKVSKDSIQEIYTAHSQAFEDVASYLLAKDISADITSLPNIDNSFGIPKEDSPAYDKYSSGIFNLMETEVDEIVVSGDTVRFVLKKHGGFLVQTYGVLAAGNAPISLDDSPRDTLTGKWYYYIMKKD